MYSPPAGAASMPCFQPSVHHFRYVHTSNAVGRKSRFRERIVSAHELTLCNRLCSNDLFNVFIRNVHATRVNVADKEVNLLTLWLRLGRLGLDGGNASVTDKQGGFDVWRIPTLLLWWIFLLVGALPEEIYWAAREAAGVVTQRALVNSPDVITLSFTLYLAIFTYRQCREQGLAAPIGQGRAIQIAIIALIAFLPFPVARFLSVGEISAYSFWDTVYLRGAVYAVWIGKLAGLIYLAGMFFRIYILGNSSLFREMFNVFPSARTDSSGLDEPVAGEASASAPAPLKDYVEKN